MGDAIRVRFVTNDRKELGVSYMAPRVFSRQGYKRYTKSMKVLFWAALLLLICHLVLGMLAIFTSISIADVLFFPAAGLSWIVLAIAVLYISKKSRAMNGQREGRYSEPNVFSRQGYKKFTPPMKVLFWVVCLLIVCQPVLLILDFFSVFYVLPWQIAIYVLMILLIVILFEEARKADSKKAANK